VGSQVAAGVAVIEGRVKETGQDRAVAADEGKVKDENRPNMATESKTQDIKGLLRSKTFWFALLGVTNYLLERFGFSVDEHTRHAISGEIVALVSLAGVLWGRASATKQVGGWW